MADSRPSSPVVVCHAVRWLSWPEMGTSWSFEVLSHDEGKRDGCGWHRAGCQGSFEETSSGR
jgi:hypothetical protein